MPSPDINNFSSSSPHRLPTVSASKALKDLGSAPRRPLATGLRTLDVLLQGRDPDQSSQNQLPGGISRGEVTEIFGPPGVGTTAFALQVSANVLHAGGAVVWVDGSYKVIGSRLRDILSALPASTSQQTSNTDPTNQPDTRLDSFHHYTAPTLSHLLALLAHQSTSFPPPRTSLIVVDSISTLFALAFPKNNENVDYQQTPVKKSDAAQWASGRRWAVMSDFVSKMGRLAETQNIAIILTSQTTTRIRSETGAVLQPAIASTAWDAGIRTRVVLFRDWVFQTAGGSSSQSEHLPNVRFAGVMKAKGVVHEGLGRIVTFKNGEHGIQEVRLEQANMRRESTPLLPATSLKRKRGEIVDSQSEDEEAALSDEEFGWVGGEETLNAEQSPE